MKRTCAIVILGVGLLAHEAGAQIVIGNEIQISSGAGVTGLEPAIAASPNDVAVVRQIAGGGGIRYRASVNAGLTFDPAGTRTLTAACSGVGGFDPCAVASPETGHLFVGAVGDNVPRTVFVARKPVGQYVAETAVALNSCNDTHEDKCFVAIGPRYFGQSSSDHSEAMYAAWTRGQISVRTLFSARSSDSGGPGAIWNESPAPMLTDPGTAIPPAPLGTRRGIGAFPVVLRTGANRGRVLVGSTYVQQAPPEWTWSDNQGTTWEQYHPLNSFGSPPTQITPVPCCPTNWSYLSTWPSVAIDPANSNHIVIAFVGGVDNASNSDIFIAESTDGGSTFPLPARHHFDDAAFRKVGEPNAVSHEFMPTVAIDGAGGICLMFCRLDTAVTDFDGVSIRFARWTSGSALSSPPTLLEDFVPRFFPVGIAVGLDGNDYHMIVNADCYVHCAYVHNDASNNAHVYYRRVRICIPAEIDANMVVDEGDAAAFAEALAQGSGRADVNHDGVLDARDATDFVNAWNAATNR